MNRFVPGIWAAFSVASGVAGIERPAMLTALADGSHLALKPAVETLSQSAKEKVDKLVEAFVSDGSTPAVELSIQKNGKTIYERGYGTIKLKAKVAPGPDTRFQIDSLTKVFTAIAVLKLVEEGKVDLDAKMGKYLNQPNPAWESIPVRQYLGMVSGIPDGGTATGTYQEVIDKVAAAKLDFDSGSQYEYSNVNYFILGNLIDARSPQNKDADPLCGADPLCRDAAYAEYTKARILAPLGMTDTGLIIFKSGDLWATPYEKGVAVAPRPPEAGFSGGGFVSTMHDLEKFAIGLYDGKILSAKSYKEMWTPTVLTSGKMKGKPVNFGLGWDVTLDGKGDLVRAAKNGGGYGWGSELNYYPETGESVILLCNGPGAIAVLAGSVHDAVAGE
jgi:CubicO group peptidase (beta-lactamase class C family)